MSKRANGEGSAIQFDELRGGYWTQISLGRVGGKRVRRTLRASTQGELLDLMDKERARSKRARKLGLRADLGKQTVREFLQHWLENVIRIEATPKTYTSYELQCRAHIIPAIGDLKLAELRPQHVRALIGEKSKSDLSARSVQYIRAVLRSALANAVSDDVLEMNVAARTKAPKGKAKEVEPLTPDQARALLEHVRGHRLEALFTVGLALGMRQGEQLGLTWEHVDLEAGTLRVEWGLQRMTVKPPDAKKYTEIYLVAPKWHSRRTITLPQVVLNGLRAHRVRQEEERELCGSKWRTPVVIREGKRVAVDLVFTTPIGSALEACNLNKLFQKILKDCGIPRHRFHDMRHTAATLLTLMKVPPKAIMKILGWSQISMLDRYTHLVDEMRQEAADQMDAVLAPRPVEKEPVASKVASRALLVRVK